MPLNVETRLALDQLRYQQQASLGFSLFYWLLNETIIKDKKPDGNGNIFPDKDLGIEILVADPNKPGINYQVDYVNFEKAVIALKPIDGGDNGGISTQPKVNLTTLISWKIDKIQTTNS